MVDAGSFPDLSKREDIQSYLFSTAESLGVEVDDDAVAAALDGRDILAHFRIFFNVPTIHQLLGEKGSGVSRD